jgi:hypothetical protein
MIGLYRYKAAVMEGMETLAAKVFLCVTPWQMTCTFPLLSPQFGEPSI